jgi:hypothetical protein
MPIIVDAVKRREKLAKSEFPPEEDEIIKGI